MYEFTDKTITKKLTKRQKEALLEAMSMMAYMEGMCGARDPLSNMSEGHRHHWQMHCDALQELKVAFGVKGT